MNSTQTPPGIACPCCGSATFDLDVDPDGRQVLHCGVCGAFCRLLERRGDPPAEFSLRPADGSACSFTAPSAGCWWLGFVRPDDGQWRAVALSPTLGGCWNAVLSGALDGDVMMTPTDKPRRKER